MFFINSLKANPPFAELFFRRIVPTWYATLSQPEKLWWWRYRKAAVSDIDALHSREMRPEELAEYYGRQGFAWTADPWKGRIDYASCAWVTMAKQKGDCDDFMILSEAILSSRWDTHRCFVYNTEGGGHAILILEHEGMFGVMSNAAFNGWFQTREAAIRDFYGSETYYWYYYE